MRIFLLLNGPAGWQTGIEDGFQSLKLSRSIDEVQWEYFSEVFARIGVTRGIAELAETIDAFCADLIVIFHVGSAPLDGRFVERLRKTGASPIIVYDEGDMYGTWAKPLPRNVKSIIAAADVVSIRGLGPFLRSIKKLNKNVIYTPHHASIARYDSEPLLYDTKKNDIVLVGNRNRPRFFSSLRRLPGAAGREQFAISMGKEFPEKFTLYGDGWEGLKGNRGPLNFFDQLTTYKDSWVTVAYEHYPDIPFYFSDRLPIALLGGSMYVSHRHPGYETQFKNCDFMAFFDTYKEGIDQVHYFLGLPREELLTRAARARAFAIENFSPAVVWESFLRNVCKTLGT